MSIKYFIYLLLATLIIQVQGCGYNKVNIVKQADGPKEIYISLIDDPLLLAVDLKTHLINKGFHVGIRGLEGHKVKLSDGKKNHNGISDYRYELLLGYNVQSVPFRVTAVSASVIDYKENKVLGSWQSSLNSNSREGLITGLDMNLLSQVFGYTKEFPETKRLLSNRHYTTPGF